MFYYYGYDWTYLIIVLPCMILAMIASASVNSTFKKYSQQYSRRRITGAQAAEQVLRANGVRGVIIQRVSGNLTDHYDPRDNIIRLSDSVYDSTSTAAIGVACHEAGHAVQYAEGYSPIKLRAAIIPITNLGSKLAMPLILIGILLSWNQTLIQIGIWVFSLAVLFQIVTLPVEFNASRRAVGMVEQHGILSGEELKQTRKVLSAAALTYVAAAAASILQLLLLIILFGGRRRND